MDKMVLRRLGSVSPGRQLKDGPHLTKDVVAMNPIVLWAGDKPAAILYFQDSKGPVGFEQKFAKMSADGSGEGLVGGLLHDYPIRFRDSGLTETVTRSQPNAFFSQRVATADVNGDGVDELILPRARGGIDVYSAEKHLYGFSGESHLPRGYFYTADKQFKLRLKGRDVVFFTSQLENPAGDGKDDDAGADISPYAVYRVDHKGIARVTLRGAEAQPAEISALGALNRPGSSDIDELLVVAPSGEDEGPTLLFRHRPDGTAIDSPKEFPLPTGEGLKFRVCPT